MTLTETLQLRCKLSDVFVDYRDKTMVNPHLKAPTRDFSKMSLTKVVFHCTDSEGWTPDRLGQFFVTERGFPICGYHYYVTAEKVYHMVGEGVITYHAAPYNTSSISFSIGYYATRDDALNVKMNPLLYENALNTATYLCLKHHILPVKDSLVGHRELFGTGWFKSKTGDHILRKTCPGLAVNLDGFRYEVARRVQTHLNENYVNPALEDSLAVDGIVGPKTIRVFKKLPKF